MQMSAVTTGGKLLLAAICVAIGAGIVTLVFAVSRESARFLGVCLVVFGALNVLQHRAVGRAYFDRSQRPPMSSKVWALLGRDGSQLMFLGIGVALVVGGIVALLR